MHEQTSSRNASIFDDSHAGEHDQGHASGGGRGHGHDEGKGSGPIFPVRSEPEPEPTGDERG